MLTHHKDQETNPLHYTPIERAYIYAGFDLPLSEKQASINLLQIMDYIFSEKGVPKRYSSPKKRAEYGAAREKEGELYKKVVLEGTELSKAWENLYSSEAVAKQAFARALDRMKCALTAPSLIMQHIYGLQALGPALSALSSETLEKIMDKAFFWGPPSKRHPQAQPMAAALLYAVDVEGQDLLTASKMIGYARPITAKEALDRARISFHKTRQILGL